MRANSSQVNFTDDRQKEYQRQQERLKAMTATADKGKSVSADLMIENLLKDSFSKVSQVSTHIQRPNTLNLELPPWLMCESELVPPQYKYLWSVVQLGVGVADTQKVSQLLMTSGLHVDVLGYIWNLANKALPGQLTKQEFYIVLALVSLAQTGYAFNNLSVLKLIPAPSIPVLDTSLLQSQLPQPCSSYNSGINPINSSYQFQTPPLQGVNSLSNSKESDKQSDQLLTNSTVKETNLVFNDGCDIKQDVNDFKKERFESSSGYSNAKPSKMMKQHVIEINKGPLKSSNFPCIGSSPTAGIEDDFSEFQSVLIQREEACDKINSAPCESGDDFTEFQSANVEHLDPFETIVITQKREIPKIPLPKNFSGKLGTLKSNILKISPESERKLKGLTQPESLSSLPESKISSNNKVSTSLSVLGSNHGIGSRLANHSLSAKLDRPKHHKHHKIKPNASPPVILDTEEEIILGVKTTYAENLIPKCFLKKSNNCQTFVLKDTKIRSDETPEFSESEHVRNECEPSSHSGENTRQIEIPMLGTFNETVLPTSTKSQTSSMDLISVQEDKYSALREIQVNMSQEKIEESSRETNDEFGDFLSADIPPPSELIPAITTPQEPIFEVSEVTNSSLSVFVKEEEKESWGEWNFSTESNSKAINIPVPVSSVTLPLKAEEDIFNSFSLLTVDESKEKKNLLTSAQPLATIQDDFFGQIESSNDLVASASSHDCDNWSSFAFENELNDKTNSFSPQIKSPSLIVSQSDNEYSDFFTSDLKPSSTGDFVRNGSLPSLNLNMSSTEEFELETVWRKCIESCHSLVQKGFEIFNNITVKCVLDEIFSAPRTSDYLNHLYIAYQISKRISTNWNEISSTQEDLERMWKKLEELCFQYKIKLIQDEDSISEGKHQCKICFGYTNQNFISQGISTYHPSCANLWINLVDETLPCFT